MATEPGHAPLKHPSRPESAPVARRSSIRTRLTSSLLLSGAAGTVLAMVIVAVITTVARRSGDPLLVAPEFGGSPTPLSTGVAVGATVVGGVVGTVLAGLARRTARRPRSWFGMVCMVLLAGYGALSFVRAEEVSTGVWLNVMHVGAAVAIVGLLLPALGVRPDAPASGDGLSPSPDQPTGSST